MSEPQVPSPTPQGDAPLAPAVRRRLQQCFDHASKLAKQKDCDRDYIHDLFAECVVHDPNNLIYLDALVENLIAKFGEPKKARGMFAAAGRGGPLKKLVAKNEHDAVIRQGLALLKASLWDVSVLRAMAEACAARRHNECELRYLKLALDANPRDAETSRHCALTLARVGQFDQAIVCWHRVEELKPNDVEAPKMIAMLTLEKQRSMAGLGDSPSGKGPSGKPPTATKSDHAPAAPNAAATNTAAGKSTPSGGSSAPASTAASSSGASAAPVAGSKPAAPVAASAPQPAQPTPPTLGGPALPTKGEDAKRREIQLTPRQRLERAINEYPADVTSYVALGELLLGEGRNSEAERVLVRALQIAGGDLRIRELLEDSQMARARDQVAVAERRASFENSAEALELVKKMKSDCCRLELEIYHARSERRPGDAGVRFELGIRLKRGGSYSEAVKTFQELRENPAFKASATMELGECLQHLKQYPKALACYSRAAELFAETGGIEERKLALYRAGVLAAGLKDHAAAIKFLREVASLDPNYRDVVPRLDKLSQIGDKE